MIVHVGVCGSTTTTTRLRRRRRRTPGAGVPKQMHIHHLSEMMMHVHLIPLIIIRISPPRSRMRIQSWTEAV
jgi:hypothetical protein